MELTTAGFELSGATVFDDAEDGDLFIGDVPVLRPASSVVWARIGEEREGGWKGENFKPADRSLADVLQGRQGRFFLRVYDATGKLLDSDEFRYCEALQAIRVDDAPYTKSTLLVPPATGHLPTEVRFLGSDGATVVPTLTGGATHAAVGPGGIRTATAFAVLWSRTPAVWTSSSSCPAYGGGKTLLKVKTRMDHGETRH